MQTRIVVILRVVHLFPGVTHVSDLFPAKYFFVALLLLLLASRKEVQLSKKCLDLFYKQAGLF